MSKMKTKSLEQAILEYTEEKFGTKHIPGPFSFSHFEIKGLVRDAFLAGAANGYARATDELLGREELVGFLVQHSRDKHLWQIFEYEAEARENYNEEHGWQIKPVKILVLDEPEKVG